MGYLDHILDAEDREERASPHTVVVSKGVRPPHVVERYDAVRRVIVCSCLMWAGPEDKFQGHRISMGLPRGNPGLAARQGPSGKGLA